MTATAARALTQALALLKTPTGLSAARAARFPEGITVLLRLVAVDVATIEHTVAQTGETEAVLRDAAEFYVLQVCFTPGIDSYRVLGANRDDSSTRIREHYRLLVRWLHPDRNSDAWQTVFLDRVNRAWRDLRGDQERSDYDQMVLPAPDTEDASHLVAGMPRSVVGVVPGHAIGKWISARTMRRLPSLVLGGLGALASAFLVLMYFAHSDEVRALRAARIAEERALADAIASAPRRTSISAEPTAGAMMQEPAPEKVTGAISIAEPPAGTAEVIAATVAVNATPPERAASTDIAAARTTARSAARSVERKVSPEDLADREFARAPNSTGITKPFASEVQDASASEVQDASATLAAASASSAAAAASNPGAILATGSAAATPKSDGDQYVVDELLQQFRDAYDEGDLIKLMALFTRDARNMAQGSKLLADDYRELFESSRMRTLSLHDMSWWREGDVVAVVATFDASITPIGRSSARRIGGDIRFELRREDGAVRIARIRHQTQ